MTYKGVRKMSLQRFVRCLSRKKSLVLRRTACRRKKKRTMTSRRTDKLLAQLSKIGLGPLQSTLAANPGQRQTDPPPASDLLFAMRLDGHVARRVGHAREAEALLHLVVVQEGLVGLIDAARDDLASTARARARAARVGEVDAVLLRLVEDVDVLGAL